MKAALLHRIGEPLSVEEVVLDGPAQDEVRIRVLASGLCHSDYHMMQGNMTAPLPALLGHEVAGIIEAVGADVPNLRRGDRVVTSFSAYCGACPQCQTGFNHRCDDKPGKPRQAIGSRVTLDGRPVYQMGNLGGFAEEMVVHHRSVARLPDGVPMDAACLMGCAVLTGVGAALNGAKIRPGSSVAVLGCGGVGLNVVQGARIAGATRIIAVDRNPAKLDLAKTFGATDVLLADEDMAARVRDLSNGGVDYGFEVVGLPATMRDTFLMVRKGGTAVLLGVTRLGEELTVPAGPILHGEMRIMGSLMGSSPFQLFLPQLVDYYRLGTLKLDELISRRIPLEEINQGYADMIAGSVARSVITF